MPNLNSDIKDKNKEIVKKSKPKQSKTVHVIGSKINNPIMKKVQNAVLAVKQHIEDNGTKELVRDENRLREYLHKARQNGILVIDTEGDSLDPIDNNLAGIGFYTPNEKPIYVPMHHIDITTMKEYPNQISDEMVRQELKKCLGIKLIYHNAKYDIRVIGNYLKIYLPVFWCTQLASNFLNELEVHKLKVLWNKYINKGKEKDALNFSDLFEGIPYQYMPIELSHLYAAGDPKITYDLFEFQFQFLNPDSKLCKEKGLYEASLLLKDTELPLISYLVEMEDTGVCISQEKSLYLSKKYNEKLIIEQEKVLEFIKTLDLSSLNLELRSKLSNPVNLNSPTQLAILIYDVMKLKSPIKDKPRGTGEEILESLSKSDPKYAQFFKDLLEYRGIAKLLSTYIDKLYKIVKPKTKRLHGSFNQYGAKTGRFSSSDPNLQNIPAHNKEIRTIFIPGEGMVFVSGDYSQQEPRVLAHCSGDEQMKQAYADGKDLYGWVASVVYRVPYEECLEFRPDGSLNPEGKKRRQSMKEVVLGLMYGRGANSIAEKLGISKKEAQKIITMFFEAFPKVKIWIEETHNFAKENGYVQTVWGRKRRLPDIQLPEYEFYYLDGEKKNEQVEQEISEWFYNRLKNCWSSKDKKRIKDEARKQGIRVKDNGGYISEAERQAVNSIIQGTSADITKRAMLLIGRNEELKKLDYKMLLTVHDEIIGECPKENSLKAKEIIKTLMLSAANLISLPMKVDFEITNGWYHPDITEELLAS